MPGVNPRSPLTTARFFNSGGTRFWGNTDPPAIEPAEDDILYTVREIDRIDTIAVAFYGDPTLGWVIQLLNMIYLIPNDMPPGTEIRIPRVSRLIREGVIQR